MTIDTELDMTREKLIDGDIDVVIPDNIDEKNLELIVTLALKSYAEQMEVISFLEVKNRMKAYEVAERYLGQAKDARYKLDRLQIERDKGNNSKPTQKSTEAEESDKEEEQEDTGPGKSRKEIMALRRVK